MTFFPTDEPTEVDLDTPINAPDDDTSSLKWSSMGLQMWDPCNGICFAGILDKLNEFLHETLRAHQFITILCEMEINICAKPLDSPSNIC